MALRGAALGIPNTDQGMGTAQATRRIQRELKEISESPSRHWTAGPVADDLFEWQFAVRGPPGTDYEGGIYAGRIILPMNYPLAPPSITLLTPNGRWEVGKKICLSNTNYHPDLWQPAWGIRTMMEALRSHFPMPGDGAIGAVDWPSELRQQLARESLDWSAQPGGKTNRELLPELSPEELKEELPEPLPFLPPEEVVEAAPPSAPVAEGGGGSVVAEGAVAPVPTPSAAAGPDEVGLPEGLRHRHGGQPAAEPAEASAVAPAAVGALGGQDAEGSAASGGAGGARAPRRRRAPQRQQRRPQPLLVQLLKPPQSGRGWVLLLIDMIITLLTISFLMGLTDLIRSPPKLLDPLPDSRSSAD